MVNLLARNLVARPLRWYSRNKILLSIFRCQLPGSVTLLPVFAAAVASGKNNI